MSVSILSARHTAALESMSLADGKNLSELMHEAIQGCFAFIQKNYPLAHFPSVALLAGNGHNGGDALGIGTLLLREGRNVTALLGSKESALKPLTAALLRDFELQGGKIITVHAISDIAEADANQSLRAATFWIDGLFGFGLNRPVKGMPASLIDYVNRQNKNVVAIDIPSGLSCDLGILGGSFIQASTTLALGVLKPAHVDDTILAALGQVHCIPLAFSLNRERLKAPSWQAVEKTDVAQRLAEARRPGASNKISTGRVLVVAGSERYPGAGVLSCLGASSSGAGMVHACVPQRTQNALLNLMPEVIFEKRLPSLESFDAIVLGCGWVPGDAVVFEKVLEHVLRRAHPKLVLDAGAFSFVSKWLGSGQSLCEQIILTPHLGEFKRLFPEALARLSATSTEQRLNRLEAVTWAAQQSGAVVLLKGARSHIAHPTGEVTSLLESSSLLAHAGHGDVLAGLIAGLAATGLECKRAAVLAALLQSQTAIQFSERHPAALTLPPTELVRQLSHLQLRS